jgi:hypothetical protein
MKNFVNLNLVKTRDIGEDRHANLNHLHFLMNNLITVTSIMAHREDWNSYRPDYVEAVENLEFLMQDEWGFGRDASRHTHFNRLPERKEFVQ